MSETVNGTGMCRIILNRACSYCKLKYVETDTDLVFSSYMHGKVYITFSRNKEEVFDYIFVEYIHHNLNIDKTVIVVSDYLNKTTNKKQ